MRKAEPPLEMSSTSLIKACSSPTRPTWMCCSPRRGTTPARSDCRIASRSFGGIRGLAGEFMASGDGLGGGGGRELVAGVGVHFERIFAVEQHLASVLQRPLVEHFERRIG